MFCLGGKQETNYRKKGKIVQRRVGKCKRSHSGYQGRYGQNAIGGIESGIQGRKIGGNMAKIYSLGKGRKRRKSAGSKNGRKLEGGENGENGQQKDGYGQCGPSPAAEQSQPGIGDISDGEEKRKEKDQEGNEGGANIQQENPHNERGRYLEKYESGEESEGENTSSTSSSREELPSSAEEIRTGKKRDVTFSRTIFPNNDQLTRGYSL
jgi:hypothetical protein